MKRIGAALAVISIMFAYNVPLAGDADSAAAQNSFNQAGELSVGQADSTQPAVADTLAQGVKDQRGVMDRLILPALFTAAMGGMLILLFTQRGR